MWKEKNSEIPAILVFRIPEAPTKFLAGIWTNKASRDDMRRGSTGWLESALQPDPVVLNRV